MINNLLKTALGRLRIVAFIEGCSFLLLGFTMILKYKYAMPQPNYVVGLAHGILFVLASFHSAGVQKHFTFGIVGFVSLRRRPLRIELAQSLVTQPLVAFVFLCLIRSFKQA